MASTNGKQFLPDDASAATPTTSTACTKATSAAAADVPHFTAAESASASSWSRCSSPERPPAFPAEGPRPEPRGASTGGGSISPAARFEQRGNTVADVLPDAASEYSATSWSGRSFLPPRPASLAQVTWPQGKGTGTSDESYSTWTGAIIDENKSSNTKSGRHVPIQALLGESAPYGSRYWEHHDCPYNLEGLNPPGFFSPHPVWEGFAVPVTGGRSISPAARVEQKGNTVADVLADAASEYSRTSWSGRSFLSPRPASPAQVTWPQGKGTGTSDESYSAWTGATIDENKSSNTESNHHVPIQALQGESAPYGSRFWEQHDCPYNLEGMNPPGFFSPHPVWEGFVVPVQKEGRKASFFCVACGKLLSGNATRAQKHLLSTKGCVITEERKTDLKARINAFEERRTDLKRKSKESKEGISQGDEITKNADEGLDQISGTTECSSSAFPHLPSYDVPHVLTLSRSVEGAQKLHKHN